MAARCRATHSQTQNTQYAIRSAEYGSLFSCVDRNLGKAALLPDDNADAWPMATCDTGQPGSQPIVLHCTS